MSLLDLQGLTKRHSAAFSLDRVDLGVGAGTRLAILGPSGSGKTTLLRLVAGFDCPDSGRIVLDGAVVADGSVTVPAHERGIGYVAQDGALFPHLTVAENIGFGLPRREPDRRARIADLLALVDLDAVLLDRMPDRLSGGQQQRVALARALARRPRLMLLDEPFSALDTALRVETRAAVGRLLAEAGIATILVTHDQEEALSFADQVAIMRDGRLAQVGTPRQVYLEPADEAVARLLGEAIVLPATMADGWADCALGRVAVRAGLSGAAALRILVRPEQIGLGTTDAETGACLGRIEAAAFGGPLSSVDLRLIDRPGSARVGPDGGALLRIPVTSVDCPPVGATVAVTVRGLAHVFPAGSGSAGE